MFPEELKQNLNSVFNLMKENKLRQNIDDTLLEKFITMLGDAKIGSENNFDKKNFFKELVQQTDVLKLIEKCLISVKQQTQDINSSIRSFSINLFGIMLEIQDLFVSYKNSLLLDSFLAICDFNQVSSYCASVHNALIRCLMCIVKNSEGAKWSINENIPEFVFSSFESKSFFVRNSSVLYFTTALPIWSSEAALLPESEKTLLQNCIKKYLMKLISGIEHESLECTRSFTHESCIEALNKIFDISEFQFHLCNEYPLLDSISNSLFNITNKKNNNEIINILLKMMTVKNEIEPLVKDIVKSLAKQGHFLLAIPLAVSVLRISSKCRPVSIDHLVFILKPLNALANNGSLADDTFFHILPDYEVSEKIESDMTIKSKCVHLISSTLSSLATIIDLMDHQALKTVALLLNVFLSETAFLSTVLKIRLVQINLLCVIENYLSEKVFMSLNNELVTILHKYLFQLGEKIFTDVFPVVETLKLLKMLISLNAKRSFALPNEMKERLIQLLCRKLLDHREEIVDSAICLVGQIISGTDSSDWYEKVCEYDIHSLIWDLAVDGSCNGTVKATALSIMTEICQQQIYWENICNKKSMSEVAVANILYQFTFDDDFYVQRAALCSFYQWIKKNWFSVSSGSRTKFLIALAYAVKSLDLDLKLTALDAWLWLVENDNFCVKISSASDVKEHLVFLSESGFGISMLYAVQDYDDSCRYKAAELLLKIRYNLEAIGITKNYLPLENSGQAENVDNFESFSKCITGEEKNEAADCVLKLTTAQQISNIIKVKESKKPFCYMECDSTVENSKDVICSVNKLWSCIWADNLDLLKHKIVDEKIRIQDEYRCVISLLGDIIAAEDTSPSIDVPDCY